MRARSPNRKPRVRRKSKYARRVRDTEYMLWIKTHLPCVATIVTPPNRHPHQVRCDGPVEADHAGRRGIGQKADDLTCIPICTLHHGDRTDVTGIFKYATQEMLRAWIRAALEWTVARARAHFYSPPKLVARLDALAVSLMEGM